MFANTLPNWRWSIKTTRIIHQIVKLVCLTYFRRVHQLTLIPLFSNWISTLLYILALTNHKRTGLTLLHLKGAYLIIKGSFLFSSNNWSIKKFKGLLKWWYLSSLFLAFYSFIIIKIVFLVHNNHLNWLLWFPWYWTHFLKIGFVVAGSYYKLQYIKLEKEKNLEKKNQIDAYKKHLTQFLKKWIQSRFGFNSTPTGYCVVENSIIWILKISDVWKDIFFCTISFIYYPDFYAFTKMLGISFLNILRTFNFICKSIVKDFSYYKIYFIIDQQKARNFVQYTEGLSNPPSLPFYATQIINPFSQLNDISQSR